MTHDPDLTDAGDRDRAELVGIVAQLRHAYAHLVNGRVVDLHAFAEGLLAPQIRRLERLAEGPAEDRLESTPGAAPGPR